MTQAETNLDNVQPRSVPVGTKHRHLLTIAYDGTNFHGWQKQHPPDRDQPLRTVQQVVEDNLKQLLKQKLNLVGASRTDAGVHARGQVAQFDAVCPIPLDRLPLAINSRLPDDIEVLHAERAPGDDFDCINQCVSKQYRYRLFNSDHRPLELRHAAWHCWLKLDVDRMNDAADRLRGMHDFAGFAAAKHGRQSTIRTIHHCQIERGPDPELHIVVRGDGFLYNMVRILAGTLIEVGRGYWPPDRIDDILAAADRRLAGPTLPPQGLWLEWIRY